MSMQAKQATSALVLASGGLDSAALLAYVTAVPFHAQVTALTFDYGQRCRKEIEFAHMHAKHFKVGHLVKQLPMSLDTDQVQHTGADAFVPFRNLVFASAAAHYAQRLGCQTIYMAVVDDGQHPDTSAAFVASMQQVIWDASDYEITLETPFINYDKQSVFRCLYALNQQELIPLTFSCYNNVTHNRPWGIGCGICEKCTAKLEAWEAINGHSPQA